MIVTSESSNRIPLCTGNNPTDNPGIFLITLPNIAGNGTKIFKPKLFGLNLVDV